MANKNYVIKAEEFKYPSKLERQNAIKDFPELEKFGFEYKDQFELIFSEELRLKEVHRRHNLYWWDECLGNRMGFLRETYVYIITQQIRGLEKNQNHNEENRLLNTILFEYHVEIFYYLFFSTRDILFQIVNLYFSIDEEEKNVKINERFINKMPDVSKAAIIEFNSTESIKKAVELRNSFTHRYTPTGTDYRLVFKIEDGNEVLSGGGIKRESNQSFFENVNEILQSLSVLLNKLRAELVPNI